MLFSRNQQQQIALENLSFPIISTPFGSNLKHISTFPSLIEYFAVMVCVLFCSISQAQSVHGRKSFMDIFSFRSLLSFIITGLVTNTITYQGNAEYAN